MTRHPGRRASWPVEIRKLHDAVVHAAAASDMRGFDAALDRLVMLADGSDDALVLKAARHACIKLALLYDPEGLAACIADTAGFRGWLRPVIGAGLAGSRRRRRVRGNR